MADDPKVSGGADGRPGTPNEIVRYFHCARCINELPWGESPQSYARLECGMTPDGIQVWCKRHNINVLRLTL